MRSGGVGAGPHRPPLARGSGPALTARRGTLRHGACPAAYSAPCRPEGGAARRLCVTYRGVTGPPRAAR